MRLSIVIPTLNESLHIAQLISYLRTCGKGDIAEIIVADGGSRDGTCLLARQAGAHAFVCAQPGRAAQMNAGARLATGDILYFVHADTRPPASFVADIHGAWAQGYRLGCYRFAFDSDRLLLKLNAYFTRFDQLCFRGGDQSLFVCRQLFEALNGYDESYCIMEEYDFLRRARQQAKFVIMPKEVLVSARKYDCNSYLRVNFANFVVFTMFRLGFSPPKLRQTYYRLLRHPKSVS
ncbi:MAG: glycosyltransferase [Bacteroidetes bacterium]|nr:MAG: glycosyltransferase [Bacteroidota bacterium]